MSTWLTRTDAAEMLGLSARHFDAQLRPLLPTASITGLGKTLRFDAAAVVSVFVDYRIKQVNPAELALGEEEGKSPSLERLRSANADIAEMTRDRDRGLLIPREEIEPGLAQLAGVLRRAGETLKRNYGNDAAGVLNDAVSECEEAWKQMLTPADSVEQSENE